MFYTSSPDQNITLTRINYSTVCSAPLGYLEILKLVTKMMFFCKYSFLFGHLSLQTVQTKNVLGWGEGTACVGEQRSEIG